MLLKPHCNVGQAGILGHVELLKFQLKSARKKRQAIQGTDMDVLLET
jgi:hypothetical protein